MKAGGLTLCYPLVLAAGLMCGGCQQTEPLRQGMVRSTYQSELREIAEEASRKELAKSTDWSEEPDIAPDTSMNAVTQVNHWQTPSLLQAIHLLPPVPLDAVPAPPRSDF
jgi:hypothetical protein